MTAFDLLNSKFNQLIFVGTKCTKVANLLKFAQAVYKISCSETSGRRYGLTHWRMDNYRPVYNWSFLSKLLNALFRLDSRPSWITTTCCHHLSQSTVSFTVRRLRCWRCDDLLLAADGQVSALCLLDLTAAFDSPSLSSAPSSKVSSHNYCVPVSEVAGCQHLRSAILCHQLSVPRVRRSTFGTRAFSVAAPRVWNSLPDYLQDPGVDPEQFRRDLKTYLFAGHSKR